MDEPRYQVGILDRSRDDDDFFGTLDDAKKYILSNHYGYVMAIWDYQANQHKPVIASIYYGGDWFKPE